MKLMKNMNISWNNLKKENSIEKSQMMKSKTRVKKRLLYEFPWRLPG